MSGWIMPAPLQKPLITHLGAADLGGARRELREGVGGHDGARGRVPGVGLRLAGELAEQMRELAGVQRLADHAGRGDEHLARRAADGGGGGIGGDHHRLEAFLAGEGVGIAGIDDERARLALAQTDGAPITGAERVLERVSTPGDLGAGANTASSRSVRLL